MRRTLLFLTFLVFTSTSLDAQRAPTLEHYQVRADGHPLTVWAKRSSKSTRASILLLHGRTWSSLPNFDLHVRDRSVSLMDALAARGYAVYALDARGYGATPRDSSGWLTPDRAEHDASAVLDWVRAREKKRAPALLGYSRGSMVAALVAQRHPDKVRALVLYAFPQDVTHLSWPAEPASPLRERTTAAAAGEDFITPESTPAGVRDAYVRAAITDDSIRVDWRDMRQFNELDPSKLRVPVLLLNGERDPAARSAGLPAFFDRLTGIDREWVVLEHADHVAHLERQEAFVNALSAFLEHH